MKNAVEAKEDANRVTRNVNHILGGMWGKDFYQNVVAREYKREGGAIKRNQKGGYTSSIGDNNRGSQKGWGM